MTEMLRYKPNDLDLHAFLDGELMAEERIPVIKWLLQNPQAYSELLTFQLQDDLLRTALRESPDHVPSKDTVLGLRGKQLLQERFSLSQDFLQGFAIGSLVILLLIMVMLLST